MTLSRGAASAAGLALGYALDRWVGDPQRRHPVAGFGRAATWFEDRLYADERSTGIGFVGVSAGSVVALGTVASVVTRRHPWWRLVVTAGATWVVLGGRSLEREADAVAGLLAADDLAGARLRIRNLVGRDPETLDAEGVVRACVESVAENTSDAVVAPLVWGALLGIPGLLGYRAINTLDAMVGHRSERYLQFGWAAARLDDHVNWLPARLAGLLAAWAAPIVGGSRVRSIATAVRDSARHPSPNAGVVEAAFAGALGVRLGGVNVYKGSVEDRGELGRGPVPAVGDIARTTRLARVVGELALVTALAWRLTRR